MADPRVTPVAPPAPAEPEVFTINTPSAVLEFPADTPNEKIREFVGKYATTPEARQSALNQWADQYVARERKGGGTWQKINDVVRNFAQGTPVGSWLDEANAATAAAVNGVPYDEAKAYQNATDRAIDKETGKTGIATKIAGGIASLPATGSVALVRGAAAAPQMVNAAVTGALYGAGYGAGEGDTLAERAKNAGKGTVIGGGLGALAIPAAKGVSNAFGYVADKVKGLPQALQEYVPGAVQRVTRAVSDDVPNPAMAPVRAAEHGPEGMIGDLGTNTRGQVGAVARTPGRGQAIAIDAVDQRAAGAPRRITADVDAALGPAVNMPQLLDAMNAARAGNAKPLYDAWRTTQVAPTQELRDLAPILKDAGLLDMAEQRMALAGNKVGKDYFTTGTPTAEAWDYVKRAIDAKISSALDKTKPDSDLARLYEGLRGRLIGAIDNHPDPATAGVWKAARDQFASDSAIIDATKSGRTAFSRSISPDDMLAEVGGMSRPEKIGYNLGARQNVRDVMGNSSTKWGANDDTAARKMLSTPYAQDKLDILAGPDAAARIRGRIDAENAFDKTREAAKGNSVTAAMTAAQKEFPGAVDKGDNKLAIGGQSLTGLALRGLNALADAMTGGAMTERRAAIATDAAKLLTAQGASRDQIIQALMQYRESKGMTEAGKNAIDRISRGLMQAPRQAVIDEATP